MTDALTYSQRLKLGAIRVRRDMADDARRRAVSAALINDHRECEMLHAEADRHEAAIIEAARELGQANPPPPRVGRARLTPVASDSSESAIGPSPWRAAREGTAAVARPLDDWHKFVAKLG
ncbi:MAG TPA: hypothetical protein VGG27_01295 [Magnetospirillaceae bacterium]|jgi:hypothetical protein